MAEAPSSDERLPWLETPPPGARTKAVRAARRSRTPLLVLLALFSACVIAVLAYVAGRGTAPTTRPIAASTPPVWLPPMAPSPLPSPPAVESTPLATPPPAAASEQPRHAAARPHPSATKASRPAQVRRATVRHATVRRPARRSASRVAVHRNTISKPRARASYAVPQRVSPWPAAPFAGRKGRIIQLGAFLTLPQANAALWRLVRVYPYLGTLPRVITWVGPFPGRARIYQLRLAAGSRREARALCNNLHRIGRGCMVV